MGIKIIRGGSWFNGATYCRAAGRVASRPGDRFVNCGFRLVTKASLDDYRMLRGGSWFSNGGDCHSAVRGGFRPGDNCVIYGFRLAAREDGYVCNEKKS